MLATSLLFQNPMVRGCRRQNEVIRCPMILGSWHVVKNKGVHYLIRVPRKNIICYKNTKYAKQGGVFEKHMPIVGKKFQLVYGFRNANFDRLNRNLGVILSV